jgi:hypothetical protein
MPLRFPLAITLSIIVVTGASAQTSPPAKVPKDCPPGTSANAPTINGAANGTLSDKLASSEGIICPPAGVDPEMQQKPPEGGAIKVVPPPGSPGGNQRVQPK